MVCLDPRALLPVQFKAVNLFRSCQKNSDFVRFRKRTYLMQRKVPCTGRDWKSSIAGILILSLRLHVNLNTSMFFPSFTSLKVYKDEWVHFQRKKLCHFHCCLPYKLASSHKEKNLLPSQQILPLRVHSLFGRLLPPGKQTGSHENCLPSKTWR